MALLSQGGLEVVVGAMRQCPQDAALQVREPYAQLHIQLHIELRSPHNIAHALRCKQCSVAQRTRCK